MWTSDIALRQNDLAAAQKMAGESVGLLRASGDTSAWLAASQINLAAALHQQNQVEAAASLLNDALAVVRSHGNTLLTAVVLNNLAEIAVDQGDHGKAEGLLAEAVALQEQLPSAWGTPHSQLLLAAIAYARGDLRAALQHYQACLTAAWVHADQSFVYAGLVGIGMVVTTQGVAEEAATIFGAASRLAQSRSPRLFRSE